MLLTRFRELDRRISVQLYWAVFVRACDGVSVFAAGGGATEPQTPAQNFDYDFAREELVMKELGDNPIQTAIERLEHHHQQDKQSERRRAGHSGRGE